MKIRLCGKTPEDEQAYAWKKARNRQSIGNARTQNMKEFIPEGDAVLCEPVPDKQDENGMFIY